MTTYYVSANIGSDNNIGSSTAPFATLKTAANHTHPGDSVEIMNGTYTGWPGGDVLSIGISGTASAPITYEAAPGHTPLIDSTGSWNGISIHASYIIIDGLTVVGGAADYNLQTALAGYSTNNPALDGNGIYITDATHVTVQNSTVYEEGGGGIGAAGADYVQILNNTVHDTSHWSVYGTSGISLWTSANVDTAPGPHMIISGNTVYNNAQLVPTNGSGVITDGEGIILDSNQGYNGGFLVQNNIVHDNGGPGIEAFLSSNVTIINNAIWNNNLQHTQAAQYSDIFINQSSNVTVSGNTGDPGTEPPPPPPPPPPPGTGQNIVGTSGNDVLIGTAGNDTISGLGGSDRIDGAGGMDILSGGRGNDTFVFKAGEANGDSISGWHNNDSLEFHGYGNGTFTQVDSTHWAIGYENNSHSAEVIEILDGVALNDYHFIV